MLEVAHLLGPEVRRRAQALLEALPETEQARRDVAVEEQALVEGAGEQRLERGQRTHPEGAITPGGRRLQGVERDLVDARQIDQ